MIYNAKLHNGSFAAFEKIHRVRRAGGLYRIYEIKKLKYEDKMKLKRIRITMS